MDTFQLDVVDRVGMIAAIAESDRDAPLDLVVANAGIGRSVEDPTFSRNLVDTNIRGVLNTIEPAVDLMSKRGAGQVGVMSSTVGFRAFGGLPVYAASKAWARLYEEAFRGRIAKKGIGVNVICPAS